MWGCPGPFCFLNRHYKGLTPNSGPGGREEGGGLEGVTPPSKGHVAAMVLHVAIIFPKSVHVALCWPILELCWVYVDPSWVYVEAMLAHLEAMLGPCWPILALCWGYVDPSWLYVGPSWGLCWTFGHPSEIGLRRSVKDFLVLGTPPVACGFHVSSPMSSWKPPPVALRFQGWSMEHAWQWSADGGGPPTLPAGRRFMPPAGRGPDYVRNQRRSVVEGGRWWYTRSRLRKRSPQPGQLQMGYAFFRKKAPHVPETQKSF